MGRSKGAQRAAAPGKSHYSSQVQILNADNSTASPSVLLVFDSERYMFNCGEGLQRLASESKARLTKVRTFLATRTQTDALAGLPGLLLTLAPGGPDIKKFSGSLMDAGPLEAALIGPPGVRAYAEGFRPYASNNINLAVTEVLGQDAAPVVNTPVVKITPVLLRPAGSGGEAAAAAAAAAGGDSSGGEGGGGGEPAAKKARVGSRAAGRSDGSAAASLCYICEMPNTPGKFDPVKAKELGVPPGPLFGELQRGKVVQSTSGREVRPDEVMNPATVPGPLLLVLDCPTAAHADALRDAPAIRALLARLAAEGAAGARVVGVAHLTPPEAARAPAYREVCEALGAAAYHVRATAGSQVAVTCREAAMLQTKLNAIEPTVFPLGAIAAAAATAAPEAAGAGGEQQQGQGQQQHNVEGGGEQPASPHLTRLTLAPAKQQGVSSADVPPPLELANLRAGLLDAHPRVAALVDRFRAQRGALLAALSGGGAAADGAAAAAEAAARVPPELRGVPRDALELVLLGTVSAQPSSYRNVSSYYLDFFGRGGALADCGEDAMGQLERRYGAADAQRRICGLRFVWVSHMHADHHSGLYPLLARRAAAGAPPLLVIGPMPLWRVLQEYAKVVPMRYVFMPSMYLHEAAAAAASGAPPPRAPPQHALDMHAAAARALGLSVLEPFPVKHVSLSTGLRLSGAAPGRQSAPWTVVFSGDTRPCPAVVDAARGATLLIHEATFEDELASDAEAKRHSTLSEALRVASDAGVYRTVLTHFSGRYPRIPVLAGQQQGQGQQQQQQQDDSGGGVGSGGAKTGDGGDKPLTSMVGDSVAVGFDFMTVNLADLPWLPLVVPACDELLREEGFVGEGDDELDDDGGPV
ncbi:hypothetical protein Rsub_09290 [Raphidocelis subcapitata]|uniref:ribonuclease Z n=1 Tax=Raphidocelis subcapitata TaxID=307507 RepID=A0A2V0PHG1_9CHLO|nr:hypothetical protein Rsub_09290 [Raphidocelis subcapitata]|eukprot:GBF96657.1 hypothetical protein Rsub_09290 [Raphidocelis subcapitata]